MNVFVQNTIDGLGFSHVELVAEPNDTVDSLIASFCIQKGVRQRPQYVLKDKQNVYLDSTKTLESYGIVGGTVLYLTSKNEEQHVFGFHNWWILAGVALFIGVTGLVTVTVLFVVKGKVPFSYGVVFDAGSTHTSMTVYKWEGEKDEGTGLVSQANYCSENESISQYVNTPEKVGEMLERCIKGAEKVVPEEHQSTSRIFLGATAGMRLLRISNEKGADAIMAAVNETFSNSTFDFEPEWSKILTGQEEGVFGWITVNYLSKTLQKANIDENYGALDMGGASTQISFVPDSERHLAIDPDDIQLRLYGKDYVVFSRSFLCFGLSEFHRRVHFELLLESKNETITKINNPCTQNGFIYTMPLNQLDNQVCTASLNSTHDRNVTFVGKYDKKECTTIVDKLLDSAECSQTYKYCVNRSHIPETSGNFIAFSSFYYVTKDLNVSKSNLSETLKAIDHFCGVNSTTAKGMLPDDVPYDITQLCLSARYVMSLLVDVYGFRNESAWRRLSFVNKLDGAQVGWSLGFMTNATNAIPEEESAVILELSAFVMLTVLFVLFIVIGVAFVYHAWKRSRKPSSYQRFSQYGAI